MLGKICKRFYWRASFRLSISFLKAFHILSADAGFLLLHRNRRNILVSCFWLLLLRCHKNVLGWKYRCSFSDLYFRFSAPVTLERQVERNGEVEEILSDALEVYLRERWNHIFQETRFILPVSLVDICFSINFQLHLF